MDLTGTADVFGKNISSVVKVVTNKAISTLGGFSRAQLDSLAHQSAFIAGMSETDEFTDDERDFLLIGLMSMVIEFAQTLLGMIAVEIEEVYNAIVKAIYESINTPAHAALVIPA